MMAIVEQIVKMLKKEKKILTHNKPVSDQEEIKMSKENNRVRVQAGQVLAAVIDQLSEESAFLFSTTLRSFKESGRLEIEEHEIQEMAKKAMIKLRQKKSGALKQLEKI